MISFSVGGVTFSLFSLEIRLDLPRKGEQPTKVTLPTAEDLRPLGIPNSGQVSQLLATTATPVTPDQPAQSVHGCNDKYFVERPDGATFEIYPEPWMIESLRAERDKSKINPQQPVRYILQETYYVRKEDGTLVEISPEPWMLNQYRRV